MRVLAQATSEASVLQAKEATAATTSSRRKVSVSTPKTSRGCCTDQGYFCVALCGRCGRRRRVHPSGTRRSASASASSACATRVRRAFTVHPGSIHAWLSGQSMVPDSKLLLQLMQTVWWATAVPVVVIGLLWLSSPLDPQNNIQIMMEDIVVADGFRVWLWAGPVLLRLMDDMLWEMEQFSSQGTPEDGGRGTLDAVAVRRGCCGSVLGALGTWKGLLCLSLTSPIVRTILLFIPVEGLFMPLGVFITLLTLTLQVVIGTTKRSTIMRALFALVLPVDLSVLALTSATALLSTNAPLSVVLGRAHGALISIEYAILLPVMVYVLHLAAGARRALSLLQFLRYISHEVRVPTNVCMLALEESLDLLEPVAVALPQLAHSEAAHATGVLPPKLAAGGTTGSSGGTGIAMPRPAHVTNTSPVGGSGSLLLDGRHPASSLQSQANMPAALLGPLPDAAPADRVAGVSLAVSLDTEGNTVYPGSFAGNGVPSGFESSFRYQPGTGRPAAVAGASDVSSLHLASMQQPDPTAGRRETSIVWNKQQGVHTSSSSAADGGAAAVAFGSSGGSSSVRGGGTARHSSSHLPPMSPTSPHSGHRSFNSIASPHPAAPSRRQGSHGPGAMARMQSAPVTDGVVGAPQSSVESANTAPQLVSTIGLPGSAQDSDGGPLSPDGPPGGTKIASAPHPTQQALGTVVGADPAILAALRRDVGDTIGMLQDGRSALEQLQSLLNRTLDLAKLEAGRTSINRMVFSLDKLWRAIRNAVAPAYASLGVTLDMQLELGPASGKYVLADMLRIQQAAVNVLHNGAKYSPAGTTVTARLVMEGAEGVQGGSGRRKQKRHPRRLPQLHSTGMVESGMSSSMSETVPLGGDVDAKATGGPGSADSSAGGSSGSGSAGVAKRAVDSWITITIADQGRGMTAQEQLDVFVPFSRLHSGKEGTGLGLNIAKRAMQAHGGDLTVHSGGLGQGCTFTCEVPVSVVHADDVPSVLSGGADASQADQTTVKTWNESESVLGDVGVWSMSPSKTPQPPQPTGAQDPPASQSPPAAGGMIDDTYAVPTDAAQPTGAAAGATYLHTRASSSDTSADSALQSAALTGHAVSQISRLSSLAADGGVHAPPILADPSSSAAPAVPGGAMRVLVVDDDKATRRMLARVVSRFPLVADVLTANDGAKAVQVVLGEAAAGRPVTHITMDNQMPVMTGQEAVRALREAGCTARVVGLTGNVVGHDRRDFLSAGADDVLGKPVQRGDLMKALFRPGQA